MAENKTVKGLHLVIAPDAMSSTLVIYPDFDGGESPQDHLRACLAEREVALTSEVTAALERMLEERAERPEDTIEAVVARGTPPTHGKHGTIVFTERFDELNAASEGTDEGTDEDDDEDDDEDGDESGEAVEGEAIASDSEFDADEGQVSEGAIDYRSVSTILTVQKDEVVAHILPPEPGSDGVNVMGKMLACKEAKPFNLQHDSTIEIVDGETVIATEAGMLVREGGRLKVSKELYIQEYVDFTTGNVDFAGDVVVNKGIRDGFRVSIDGDLTANGMIEAACIETSGDALFRRGMAGRAKGFVDIGGSLNAHYLDSMSGVIHGDLLVDKELINCTLKVCGNLVAPAAVVFGGAIVVAGAIDVKALGTAQQGATIYAGSVESLDELIAKGHRLCDWINKTIEDTTLHQEMLQTTGAKITEQESEELTEIVFKLSHLEQMRAKIDKAVGRATTLVDRVGNVEVTIKNLIHANCVIHIRGRAYRFLHDVSGPLQITLNNQKNPIIIDQRTNDRVELGSYVEEVTDALRLAG